MSINQIMTPLRDVFMLSAGDRFDFATVVKVFRSGFSRIPVYRNGLHDVVGLLFTKDLIFIDPEDSSGVDQFINIFGRQLLTFWHTDSVGEVFRKMKEAKLHFGLVRGVDSSRYYYLHHKHRTIFQLPFCV